MLVCFNKLLGGWFSRELAATPASGYIVVGRFFKCLRDVITASPVAAEFLEEEKRATTEALFGEIYPLYGQLAVEKMAPKFDMIIVDEAQDLVRQPVLDVLNAWLKEGLAGGRWAFFGDFHRQAIYGTHADGDPRELLNALCPSITHANLSQNCRNTRRIGEETAFLSGFAAPPYRMGQVEGLPVNYQDYSDPVSQLAALRKVLGSLLMEPGSDVSDVVVLSRHRFEYSIARELENGTDFRVRPVDKLSGGTRVPTFAFATAQAFKGMESKVVVLCDVDSMETDEDRALLYVAMSRARSLLAVLLHTRTKSAVREAFKKQLGELWGAQP